MDEQKHCVIGPTTRYACFKHDISCMYASCSSIWVAARFNFQHRSLFAHALIAATHPYNVASGHITDFKRAFALQLEMLLFLLCLCAIAAPGIYALAIPAVKATSDDFLKCTEIDHCRTIWNIIWSSLATS